MTPEVNKLLNLQVEQRAEVAHADFSLFFKPMVNIIKMYFISRGY